MSAKVSAPGPAGATAGLRLGGAGIAALFLVGAVGGLIGDMCHVESGTTTYLEDPFPYVWKSQLWFPLMVGGGTAALGWIRVRMAAGEQAAGGGEPEGLREGVAMIAAVVALYALTALVRGEPQPAAVVVCWAVAALIVARWAQGPGELVCALLAAVFGVGSEIILAAAGVFEYADDIARFAGVASWLPALYLAYGVVAARLGLIAARLSVRPRAPRARR
ncbi:MAG: hypothetical protein U0R24_00755 [Solirubrobacterales bacterium]